MNLEPGSTTWAAFDDQGERRSFALHLPTGIGSQTPVPLVVVLHASGSSGEGIEQETGWSALADREGFAVVYPDGLSAALGIGRAFNHGGCCGYGTLVGVDDVAMVDALLATLESRVAIDPGRRYLVGYGNGASLAHGLASRSSDLFAAVAVYAGTTVATGSLEAPVMLDPAPELPLSVMLIMSEQDATLPFYGAEGRTVRPSQTQLAQFYAGAAGCSRHPEVERAFQEGVDIHRFVGCHDGVKVEQLTLWGWDHSWPSREAIDGCRGPGEQLHGFDAATQMWAFFDAARR